jgi:integrase
MAAGPVSRLIGERVMIALVCVCFGLRISECLALKWRDVNWLRSKLAIERAIVRQRVDDVKTIYSARLMAIDAGMLEVLKGWKQETQFGGEGDWIFASPAQLGRLPVCYPWVWQAFQNAGAKSGIGKLGTHSLRHSCRSWLDAVGNRDRGAAEADAPLRHSYHHEHLR